MLSFHNSDLFSRQSEEFIHESVNSLVRRRDLAFDGGLVGRGLGSKTVVVPINPVPINPQSIPFLKGVQVRRRTARNRPIASLVTRANFQFEVAKS